MKLNAKLVIIMLTLLILTMLTLFSLNQFAQNDLVNEIQESSQDISKAIQMSIESLTSEEESSRLTDYLQQASQRGINEINVIDSSGEIIDSSNPDKIGKQREIKKLEKGIKAVPQAGKDTPVHKPYEVVVPVIVGDEQLGYVQINMLLDNIRDIQHANFVRRLVATSLVFTIGIALIIFLARRYTAPIHRLLDDFKRVSSGDLSVTFPTERNDEIGELAHGFNTMVEKLREREVLEKRLYEAEHLSRVGQLASGIAHEIRNPLNYISLAVDHLRADLLPVSGDKREELLDVTAKIKEEIRRVNYMVLNFMNYGRPLKLRRTFIAFDTLLDKTLGLLCEKLAEQHISIERHLPENLPLLWVDQELLRNCITNLLSNAAQSMPEGGIITIGASLEQTPDMVTLTFTDQGSGIRGEDIPKIFQPYFTTKDVGVGLGLAITDRIIREHGGEIRVTSQLGIGTQFSIVLPLPPTSEIAC